MRYLVVANKTLGSEPLVQEINRRIEIVPVEFYLLAPGTDPQGFFEEHLAALRGLPPGPPDDIRDYDRTAATRHRLRHELARLHALGVVADGEIGHPDPLQAVTDVMARQEFDVIIVSTLAPGISRWLGMDLLTRIRRRSQLPVTHVQAPNPVKQ